jgi:hypothetical protein
MTHLKHPTHHNDHPDKTILQSMINMLSLRTQPTVIAKVKEHSNINGNDQVDKLAKLGLTLPHRTPLHPYEHAHSTPYYFHRDTWFSMDQTPDKGPIRHLQSYLIKYDRTESLDCIAHNFPNIDKATSTSFWNHPTITDPQKTCILKFRYNQYMGNVQKQLFFGPILYPSITCSICNSPEPDTWKHVLLSCHHPHIHALRIKRHNKAVSEIRKLIAQHKQSRCFLLMNAGTFNEAPPDNTIPSSLLPCTCHHSRCHCNARFKPDILYVQGLPYHSPPPTGPNPAFTLQFIEFTYCNDRFSLEKILAKTNKYQPLIDSIRANG